MSVLRRLASWGSDSWPFAYTFCVGWCPVRNAGEACAIVWFPCGTFPPVFLFIRSFPHSSFITPRTFVEHLLCARQALWIPRWINPIPVPRTLPVQRGTTQQIAVPFISLGPGPRDLVPKDNAWSFFPPSLEFEILCALLPLAWVLKRHPEWSDGLWVKAT